MEFGPTEAQVNFKVVENKNNQKDILSLIEAKPIQEVLQPVFQKIVDENMDFHGTKIFSDEKLPYSKIFLRKDQNNTLLIRELHPFGDSDKKRINNCYIVDLDSKMAFNVSSLATIDGNIGDYGLTTIFYENKLLKYSTFSNHTRLGGNIVWNDNPIQNALVDLKFGKGMGSFMNCLALFHEFGHRYQQNKGQFEEKKDKTILSESERNAWSFALNIVNKLKTDGLDLIRNLDNKKIKNVVDLGLLSYDRKFKNEKGDSFSNRKRIESRRLDYSDQPQSV